MDLRDILNTNREPEQGADSPNPGILPGLPVLPPLPSRWMAVAAVSSRVKIWSTHRSNWDWLKTSSLEKQEALVEKLQKAHGKKVQAEAQWRATKDFGAWEYLEGLGVQHEHQILALETWEQTFLEQLEELAPPDVNSGGLWWSALTPQGPILLRADSEWLPSCGPETLQRLDPRIGQASCRVSLVELLQLEPIEGDQVSNWAAWACKEGDAYQILPD